MKIQYKEELYDLCHIEDKHVYENMFFICSLLSEFQFLQTIDFEDVSADEKADDFDFAKEDKAESFSLNR